MLFCLQYKTGHILLHNAILLLISELDGHNMKKKYRLLYYNRQNAQLNRGFVFINV